MPSKQYWKDRAKRMEADRDERSAQRSQALADIDREAAEVDLLRTVVNEWITAGVVAVTPAGAWIGCDAHCGKLSESLLAAVNRATAARDEHDEALGRLTPERRQEALDEVDVNVTLADAALVVRDVRDDLLNPDRLLSLGALALLLGTVLPRIEYQAGCESDLYRRLNTVIMRDAVTKSIAAAAGETGASDPQVLADAALAELRRHLPKLTQETTCHQD